MKKVDEWYFPDGDDFISRRIQDPLEPNYEKRLRALLYRQILQCEVNVGTSIDIGAHVGIWSNFLAKISKKVESFEPNSNTRKCFEKNILSKYSNVSLHPYACGDDNISVPLYSGKTGIQNSGTYRILPDERIINQRVVEQIETKKIDDYNFENVSFIKIDAEGYEDKVIKGAEKTIEKYKPFMLLEKNINKDEITFIQNLGAEPFFKTRRNWLYWFPGHHKLKFEIKNVKNPKQLNSWFSKEMKPKLYSWFMEKLNND